MLHNSIVERGCRLFRQDGFVKVTLTPLVQCVLVSQFYCWQYLGSHVLGEPPVIIFTHQNQHFFSFLKAEYVDSMLTVIIGRLVFTAAFLVGHATVTAVLDGS